MICFPVFEVWIHSTTGNGTPATSQVKKILLPVLFETLRGGKVISGARNQLISIILINRFILPESHGLRLNTLIIGFCSIFASLLVSIKWQ